MRRQQYLIVGSTVGLEQVFVNGTTKQLSSNLVRRAFDLLSYKHFGEERYFVHPLLLFLSPRPHMRVLTNLHRRVRSTEPCPQAVSDTKSCSLQLWYTDITKFFNHGNLTIMEPKVLRVNFCSGTCLYLYINHLPAASMNAMFLSWKPKTNTGSLSLPDPICIPSTFKATWILFRENFDFVIEKLTDFIVTSCSCA